MQREESINFLNKVNLQRLFKLREYYMTISLKKLDEENQLTIDNNSLSEHYLKAELLTKSKSEVFQYLSESEFACLEVLEVVFDFLIKKQLSVFECFEVNSSIICNNKTSRKFNLSASFLLKIAARLVTEDLNVLTESDKGYIL